jgi:hypothetical protein
MTASPVALVKRNILERLQSDDPKPKTFFLGQQNMTFAIPVLTQDSKPKTQKVRRLPELTQKK